jgi:hypothetical protein
MLKFNIINIGYELIIIPWFFKLKIKLYIYIRDSRPININKSTSNQTWKKVK